MRRIEGQGNLNPLSTSYGIVHNAFLEKQFSKKNLSIGFLITWDKEGKRINLLFSFFKIDFLTILSSILDFRRLFN